MLLHTWGLPAALRAAGLTVTESRGWTTRTHGELPFNPAVVWHHDASPKGDSPGALTYMISNWPVASAQIWINRAGGIHLVGAGRAFHAGATLPGKPTNLSSIGIETDHTTGEPWPPAQLDALRRCTAVILEKGHRNAADALHFHSTICYPPGRKTDPDGLTLQTERLTVAAVAATGAAVTVLHAANPTVVITATAHPAPTEPTQDEGVMIRLVKVTGSDTIWLVDIGQHTKRKVSGGDELGWLNALQVKSVGGDQPAWTIADYRDIT